MMKNDEKLTATVRLGNFETGQGEPSGSGAGKACAKGNLLKIRLKPRQAGVSSAGFLC